MSEEPCDKLRKRYAELLTTMLMLVHLNLDSTILIHMESD